MMIIISMLSTNETSTVNRHSRNGPSLQKSNGTE